MKTTYNMEDYNEKLKGIALYLSLTLLGILLMLGGTLIYFIIR